MARKIVGLLDDPERRARMGEFGRNRVIQLEWQFEVPKLLAAYHAHCLHDLKSLEFRRLNPV